MSRPDTQPPPPISGPPGQPELPPPGPEISRTAYIRACAPWLISTGASGRREISAGSHTRPRDTRATTPDIPHSCYPKRQDAPMERKKTGRPSKGPRAAVCWRFPRYPLLAAAKEQAAQRGMTLTDFAAMCLARETGVDCDSQEGTAAEPSLINRSRRPPWQGPPRLSRLRRGPRTRRRAFSPTCVGRSHSPSHQGWRPRAFACP